MNWSRWLVCLSIVSPAWLTSIASAQLVWLVPETDVDAKVCVHTAASAPLDGPDLDKLAAVQLWRICERRKVESVAISRDGNSVWVAATAEDSGSTYCLSLDCGVSPLAGESERTITHAKAQTSADPSTWRPFRDSKRLPLEIIPKLDRSKYGFTVLSFGRPQPNATVEVFGPDSCKLIGETDEDGCAFFDLPHSGLYGAWARSVDLTKHEFGERPYSRTTHLSTLTLPIEVVPRLKLTTN
ncbi:MAG: hypothetical protein JWP89_3 [Schlesneria sp.]|nr:hypothetical protein [Schlesneria sp.]